MYVNSACSVAEVALDVRRLRRLRALFRGAVHVHAWSLNTCSSVNKVDVSWLSAFKIEISWSVKGYHYFKVKPNPGEVMQVRGEYNNPVDPNTMTWDYPQICAELLDNFLR